MKKLKSPMALGMVGFLFLNWGCSPGIKHPIAGGESTSNTKLIDGAYEIDCDTDVNDFKMGEVISNGVFYAVKISFSSTDGSCTGNKQYIDPKTSTAIASPMESSSTGAIDIMTIASLPDHVFVVSAQAGTHYAVLLFSGLHLFQLQQVSSKNLGGLWNDWLSGDSDIASFLAQCANQSSCSFSPTLNGSQVTELNIVNTL